MHSQGLVFGCWVLRSLASEHLSMRMQVLRRHGASSAVGLWWCMLWSQGKSFTIMVLDGDSLSVSLVDTAGWGTQIVTLHRWQRGAAVCMKQGRQARIGKAAWLVDQA